MGGLPAGACGRPGRELITSGSRCGVAARGLTHSHPDWSAMRMASTRFRAPILVMMLEM